MVMAVEVRIVFSFGACERACVNGTTITPELISLSWHPNPGTRNILLTGASDGILRCSQSERHRVEREKRSFNKTKNL